MDESVWIAFRNQRGGLFPVHDQGRAAAKELEQVHQVLLFQLGLRFANGEEAKPGVYDAFFGCPPSTCGCSKAGAWRSSADYAPRRAVARVESRVRGDRYRSLGSAPLNDAGYFREGLPGGGAAERVSGSRSPGARGSSTPFPISHHDIDIQ